MAAAIGATKIYMASIKGKIEQGCFVGAGFNTTEDPAVRALVECQRRKRNGDCRGRLASNGVLPCDDLRATMGVGPAVLAEPSFWERVGIVAAETRDDIVWAARSLPVILRLKRG